MPRWMGDGTWCQHPPCKRASVSAHLTWPRRGDSRVTPGWVCRQVRRSEGEMVCSGWLRCWLAGRLAAAAAAAAPAMAAAHRATAGTAHARQGRGSASSPRRRACHRPGRAGRRPADPLHVAGGAGGASAGGLAWLHVPLCACADPCASQPHAHRTPIQPARRAAARASALARVQASAPAPARRSSVTIVPLASWRPRKKPENWSSVAPSSLRGQQGVSRS